MSYNVSISAKVEGINYYIELCELGNITWNVRELILQSSGWDIQNEDSNGSIKPWLKKIQKGITELTINSEKYKQYESPNGWGTVEGTLNFYNHCLQNAKSWLKDNKWNEELCKAAVIYVG